MNTVSTTKDDPWYINAVWTGLWVLPPICVIGGLIFGGVKAFLHNKEYKLLNKLFKEWTPDSTMTFHEKYSDGLQRTPLLIAVQVNNLALVEHLLKKQEHGTKTIDYDDNTPLHYAAAFGTPQMMRKIIDSTPGPITRNRYNLTPIDIAAKRPDGAEILAMLCNEEKYKLAQVLIPVSGEYTPLIPEKTS